MLFREKNNRPLFENLARRNHDLAHAVREAFSTLLLPEPQAHEYFCTGDRGYAMFSNIHGCTIRVSSNLSCPPIENDRILQPLISVPAAFYRVDVKPGVQITNSKLVSLYLKHIVKRDQIDFHDANTGNSGFIPAHLIGTKYPYAIIIDDGAIKELNESCQVQKILLQDRVYGDLKEAFATALHAPPEQHARRMKSSWQACAHAKDEGRLICGWLSLKARTQHGFQARILRAAETYSAALTKFGI